MMRVAYRLLGITLLVALMVSCSSTKDLKKVEVVKGVSATEYVEGLIINNGSWDAVTAKMSFSLEIGDKTAVKKINGTVRIKKGEVIQMSITPLLGIEVARVEISPKGVLVIDRMNKRYVDVPFAELESLSKTNLDFNMLQALFLNELFLPGKDRLTSRDVSAFKVKSEAGGVLLDVKKGKRFNYCFLTQAPEGLLRQSSIMLSGTSYHLDWAYDDFRSLENKLFPTDMQVLFKGGKDSVKAVFGFSRLSTNSNWESHTKVSSKYKKVGLEEVFNQLLKK